MAESEFFYVVVPAGTDALLLTGSPIYGVWAGGERRRDLPLQRVGLHRYMREAKEEAERLSQDYPYLVEITSIEFRAGSFSMLENAPRGEPILFYLGERYERKG